MSRKSQEAPLLDADGPSEIAIVPPAPVSPEVAMIQMLERVATSRDVDVAKLEKIIDLQERILAHNAKAAFDAAYSRMQPEIPEIDEKGKILVKGSLRSTYARLEDIHEAIKPILAKYGFALRHRTEWPDSKQGIIRIVGILSHEQGHSEASVFEAPMDRSEYRTDIQSMGSTVSYGRRYTTLDLLNITTRGMDNDGATAGRPAPPDGFDAWAETLPDIAMQGMKALTASWNTASREFREYMGKHDPQRWQALKKAAEQADKDGRR